MAVSHFCVGVLRGRFVWMFCVDVLRGELRAEAFVQSFPRGAFPGCGTEMRARRVLTCGGEAMGEMAPLLRETERAEALPLAAPPP